MNRKFTLKYGYGTALLYFAMFFGMLCLNFTMDGFEPFSLALYAAMLVCGMNVFASAGLFLLAGGLGFTQGWVPFVVCAAQGILLAAVFLFYARAGKGMRAEIALYLLAAVGIYVWLFGACFYGDYIRALIAGAAMYVLCFAVCGALRCVLFKAGRCRLSADEIVFCAAAFAAVGIGFFRLAGEYAFEAAAIFLLLLSAATLRNANAVCIALVLSLPEVIVKSAEAGRADLSAAAVLCFCSALALAFLRTGKLPAALAVFLADLIARYFLDFYGAEGLGTGFYLSLLVPLIPCFLFALLPEKLLSKWSEKLKRYGDKQLTRLTIQTERALAGERLFDMAAVFKEIENTFLTLEDDAENESGAEAAIGDGVIAEVCASCAYRERCESEGVLSAIPKLVSVGCGKGKANLIDMPAGLAGRCANPSGLLFCLNKLLAEYRRHAVDIENAEAARKLLADQARAVSEMLKELAVERSAPLNARAPLERKIGAALGRSGVICQEIMVLGEDPAVSLTATGKYDGAKIAKTVAEAMGTDMVLSSKTALAADKFCYVFRRRPAFDAAFGVSCAKKEGESASGDTHSVIKIDERTFLMALSDGMGSGEYARKISESAVSLVESFYRAKLPPDLILTTVNRLLSFNKEESFACIDVATVDLDSGRADVVKIGSPLGFLLTPAKIEILESESLPLGILDGVRPTTLSKTLSDGDTLLFISDGITAAFGSSADLAEYLCTLSPLNPQSLTDSLLDEALRRAGGRPTDDMTAVATRLFSVQEDR